VGKSVPPPRSQATIGRASIAQNPLAFLRVIRVIRGSMAWFLAKVNREH